MLCLFGVLFLTSAKAQAPGLEDQARALYEQGVRFYQQGDFATAIRLWQSTYELTPLPALLHNIAKATEENNQPREALAAWKEYHAVAPPEGRGIAEARIAALEVVVATIAQAPPPSSAPVPAPVVTGSDPDGGPISAPREPRSYRTLGSVLLAAGATGALVSGSVLANGAYARAAELAPGGCANVDGLVLCDDPTATQLRSQRLQVGVGVALIAGGLALGGGSVYVAVSPGQSANLTLAMEW